MKNLTRRIGICIKRRSVRHTLYHLDLCTKGLESHYNRGVGEGNFFKDGEAIFCDTGWRMKLQYDATRLEAIKKGIDPQIFDERVKRARTNHFDEEVEKARYLTNK